ncbi:ABC transporter [Paramagnetospirillum caucaseum]|uniref:ABC transporter n=2 Tax=Paramagnetospirillum caucaseum TaxID=1244869 RepID=M3AAK6_9PROT|nr:ABC transporter [Paramagnetospirillum caucaseum]
MDVNVAPNARSAWNDAMAILTSMGRRESLVCNGILPLTLETRLWLVEAGTIDVFAVEKGEGDRLGRRHHLHTVTGPGLLAGLGQASAHADVEILAVSRGATATVLDGSTLAAAPASAATQLPLAWLLDRWIEGMGTGLVRNFAPRSAHPLPLIAGANVTPTEGSVVAGHKGVTWAHLAAGSGRYMGIADMAADGISMIPLSPETWLAPVDGLAVAGYGSPGLLSTSNWWRHVQTFHDAYLLCLGLSLDNQRKMEGWRLEKRADKIADALGTTFGRFARLVGVSTDTTGGAGPDNALASACAIACRPLGITIEQSPQLIRRRGDDRPLTVEEVARAARIRARHVALRGEWWREDLGPLVAFSGDDGRPLAVVPDPKSGYRLHDPAQATEADLDEATAVSLSPMAWTFYAPLPDGPLSAMDLLRLGLRHQKRDVAVALAAGALGGFMGMMLPIATSSVFQTIIPGHHTSQLIQVGLALVMAAAASTIFKITGDVALLRIEGRIAGHLQAGIIDRLLRLPSSFFAAYSTGDLAQRTLTVEMVRKAMTGLVLSSFLAGVFSIFSLGLLFYYQPMTALVALLLLLLMLGFSVWVGARQLATLFEGEALSGNIVSLVLQLISSIQKLRVAGAEDRAFVLWGRNFAELRTRTAKSRRIANLHATVMAGWDILSLAVVFLVVSIAAGAKLETGQFLAFIAAFTLFMGSLTQVSRAVIQCFNVKPMIDRTKPLLEAVPEVDATKEDPGRLSGDIEVNNVYFRYDHESPRVLNGLTLQVRPGEFIALVGPSGCGKSTLMKLLLGFERPEAGGIFLDGHDLRTLDVQAVRRQVGVVLQAGRVMPGSIYENIKGAADATVDDCWEAARMAGLEDDIRAMPMGMHTMLTEGSAALSGGQVQRMLIARAVVSKPRLLLFDEATSALDNRTQAIVTESLSKLSVTRIAIAHRLSTVKDADRIYVLKDGRVIEAGNYDDLMAKNGLFSELARRQLT